MVLSGGCLGYPEVGTFAKISVMLAGHAASAKAVEDFKHAKEELESACNVLQPAYMVQMFIPGLALGHMLRT